jgi:DNA-3-methyladenine glycosylase
MAWMLNVVTGPISYPAAVLISGVDTLAGPGRLTKTMGNRAPLTAERPRRPLVFGLSEVMKNTLT